MNLVEIYVYMLIFLFVLIRLSVGLSRLLKANISVLNQETPREVIMSIIERKNPSQTNIVNWLGISAPSVNWHVKRVVTFDIINEIREERYKGYQPNNTSISSKYITQSLRSHHSSVWNKWSNRLVEMFLSYSIEDK